MGRASWVNAANQIELARKEATPQGKLDLHVREVERAQQTQAGLGVLLPRPGLGAYLPWTCPLQSTSVADSTGSDSGSPC